MSSLHFTVKLTVSVIDKKNFYTILSEQQKDNDYIMKGKRVVTLLGTCTYSNYNNSYSKYYEYKGNVISRIT